MITITSISGMIGAYRFNFSFGSLSYSYGAWIAGRIILRIAWSDAHIHTYVSLVFLWYMGDDEDDWEAVGPCPRAVNVVMLMGFVCIYV